MLAKVLWCEEQLVETLQESFNIVANVAKSVSSLHLATPCFFYWLINHKPDVIMTSKVVIVTIVKEALSLLGSNIKRACVDGNDREVRQFMKTSSTSSNQHWRQGWRCCWAPCTPGWLSQILLVPLSTPLPILLVGALWLKNIKLSSPVCHPNHKKDTHTETSFQDPQEYCEK